MKTTTQSMGWIIAFNLVLGLLTPDLGQAGENEQQGGALQARLSAAYGKLPLRFEANQGQADSQVKFLSRGSGYSLFLTHTEAVLALRRGTEDGELRDAQTRRSGEAVKTSGDINPRSAIRNPQSTVLRLKLVGANPQP
jgi:hypothetical protein